jgi:transposase
MKPDALKQFIHLRNQLTQERARLEARIREIDKVLGGEIPTPFHAQGREPRKHGRLHLAALRPASRQRTNWGPRGKLKEQIVRTLKAAGKDGATVKALAEKIGARYNNISIWFLRGGKKLKAIRKIGPAKYAWVGE